MISRDAQGSSGRERARWIEPDYATQMEQKAASDRGNGFYNGGLMERIDYRWTADGKQAAERCRPDGGRRT